jgi:hypothetical protein
MVVTAWNRVSLVSRLSTKCVRSEYSDIYEEERRSSQTQQGVTNPDISTLSDLVINLSKGGRKRRLNAGALLDLAGRKSGTETYGAAVV